MSTVTICVVVFGDAPYYAAANETVRSALDHSDAQVRLVAESAEFAEMIDDRADDRVDLRTGLNAQHGARRFMTKLDAWVSCVRDCRTPLLVLLDADAVFAADTNGSELAGLLGNGDFAMVEQTRLERLGWGRAQYYERYCDTTLRAIDPSAIPVAAEAFRFFNSGFVLCRKPALGDFLQWYREWAPRIDIEQIAAAGLTLTDQDFLQIWCNQWHPERAATLDWSWNHSTHWDAGFPRPGARVIHFSDFYRTPTTEVIAGMRAARMGEG